MKTRFLMSLVLTVIIVLGCASGKSRVGEDARVYVDRADACEKQGDVDLAIKHLTRAIEIDSRYAEAYFKRGLAYAKKHNNEQAAQNLERACDLGHDQACESLEDLR